jgi:hypothetical protein
MPLPVVSTVSAASLSPASRIQDRHHPCRDGRYSVGRPRTCEDVLDDLDRWRPYRDRAGRSHPCTDGRYSDGRPRTCEELLDHLDRRRRYDDWRGWR